MAKNNITRSSATLHYKLLSFWQMPNLSLMRSSGFRVCSYVLYSMRERFLLLFSCFMGHAALNESNDDDKDNCCQRAGKYCSRLQPGRDRYLPTPVSSGGV